MMPTTCGLLARHAVLYLNEEFCGAAIQSQLEALTNRNFPHPGDIGMAALHASHVILTPVNPMCRQPDRPQTDINLLQSLPDNDLDRKESAESVKNSTFRPSGQCLVSHKHKFILIPIAKNASSILNTEFLRPPYHSQMLPIGQLDKSVLSGYFKFAFLRDPVARATSAYQEISLRQESGQPTVPTMAFSAMEDDEERFRTFVNEVACEGGDVHVIPQSNSIYGVEIDFFGRVESLEDDMQRVFTRRKLGDCPALPFRRSRSGRKSDYDYDRYNIDENSLPADLVTRIREIYHKDVSLIETFCPLPALRGHEIQRPMSSQSIALSIAANKQLSPIELFSGVNQSHHDCLVYCLGDRGFFAEVSTVARAMIYAWANGLQLLLSSEEFAWKGQHGWTDYFEPFCHEPSEVDPARIKQHVAFTRTGDREPFNILRGYQPEELIFGHRRIIGFENILAFFVRMIFQPVEDCQSVIDTLSAQLGLPADYDALHIRRGDKVGDEDVHYPVEVYLNRLAPIPAGRTLFVMSDSYQAVEEIRDNLKQDRADVRVVTLVERQSTGFDVWGLRRGEKFMGQSNDQSAGQGAHQNVDHGHAQSQKDYILQQTQRLLAETVVAAGSSRFISTWLSNVGRTVCHLHPRQSQCQLLTQRDITGVINSAVNMSQPSHHNDSRSMRPLWRWIHKELNVQSVLEVGGQEGAAAAFFRDLGCQVQGINAEHFNTGPWIPDQHPDMVWCCDFVAQVEERLTQNFLATFAHANKYVFMNYSLSGRFSGRPSHGQTNRQAREYWVKKVERLGFRCDENLCRKAQQAANASSFAETGLVFVRDDSGRSQCRDAPKESPAVHATGNGNSRLPVSDMEIVAIGGHRFYLFLDIFVHPSRDKVVAVLPFYYKDWEPADHGVDVEKVDLVIDQKKIRGTYIPHRLDSWEPCALLDFEHPKLSRRLENDAEIEFVINVGPHSSHFSLSTIPEPPKNVLMSLVVKNENRWIRHFLEYYLQCLKVDHVAIYDNGTTDQKGLLNALQPYFEAGTVTYIPWNYRWRNHKKPQKMIAQPQQEAHSLNRFANCRWIGFLDVDEFLRIPGRTLPAFLKDFERANVDGLSFGLRWFEYEGALEFDELIDPPLTFLASGRDALGRKRQKLFVLPCHVRFLRLHSLEEGGRELQVDDTEIYFHHYRQREDRFCKTDSGDEIVAPCTRDDYMLRFAGALALEGSGQEQAQKPQSQGQWIRHIIRSIAEAETGRSRLSDEVLSVDGLCGTITRHFYNNICNFKGCRYLEIGSLGGASTTAAIHGNNVAATCIDNFSQFQGSREKFISNIERFGQGSAVRLIQHDCFELDTEKMGPFDIYLYDGSHSRNCHYKAIKHYFGTLAPFAVVIIDDWNRPHIREGTGDALRDLGISVRYKKEIILPEEDLVDMPRHRGKDGWWNGILIMLLAGDDLVALEERR